MFYVPLVNFYPCGFFFHRNQKATIIAISPGLCSVYIHAIFYFLLSNFCIQSAAESRNITVFLLNICDHNLALGRLYSCKTFSYLIENVIGGHLVGVNLAARSIFTPIPFVAK